MFYSKCNRGYVLTLEIGDEVQETLRRFALEVGLKSGFYTGIGTIHQVELAFFCKDAKHYDRKYFDGEYELSFLGGNLSEHDEIIAPHTHVVIGDRNFRTFSGHLVRGVISVTAELLLITTDLALTREFDPILQFQALVSPKRKRLEITA